MKTVLLLDCPLGFYGAGCKYACQCSHGEPCHPETGTCQCGPGFLGARCAKGESSYAVISGLYDVIITFTAFISKKN